MRAEADTVEWLLADLIQGDTEKSSGLQAYIRDMMAVMACDANRRERLVSQRELEDYTGWLALAVTETLHYFIGHDYTSPWRKGPCPEGGLFGVVGIHHSCDDKG
jgi:hypothetical protein